jgi:hypothetical protein
MRQRVLVSAVLALSLILFLALPAGAQTFQELFDQGAAAYGSDWALCAERFGAAGKAATHDRQAARAFFAAAACAAGAGQKEAAFGYLDQAAARGHDDMDRATGNPQIQSLQDDPRWKTFLQGVETRHAEREKKNNAELTRLYEDDQADRAGGTSTMEKADWTTIDARDKARQERVHQILAQGGARTADDYYHAAMVFQHGDADEEIAKAHELSLKAAELDPEHPAARWLAAASKDRLLMRQGKPQLYGTQFKKAADGKWVLHEVDPSVTDEERAKWDCPPLAEARKRAEAMNAGQH